MCYKMLQLPFKKLKMWQKSMDLVEKIYALTRKFPHEELYCCTSQMRRAALSIPSNIAEGSQRGSEKEFANFLLIAKGSLAELETQVLIVERLGYISSKDSNAIAAQIDEIAKMVFAYRNKLLTSHS